MPGVDGWKTCEERRSESDVPIMLVSALSHHMDIVRGLCSGADDITMIVMFRLNVHSLADVPRPSS